MFAKVLITGLATRFRPDQAHVYVVERYPGGLADYARLPHCGGVFTPAEPDRIRRLVGWLDEETQRRNTAGRGEHRPRIVVVIDGWEHFEDRADPAFTETSLAATLRAVVAAGAPLGIHIVPLGGHDMLNHKLPTYYTRRLLLPFPKEETRRAHLTSKMTSPPVIAGRAIDAAGGRHVQLCHTSLTANELIAQVPAEADATSAPRRFPSLPTRITVDELPLPHPPPSPTWIPLGIGGPDTATIGVDLLGGTHTLLVSGPAGSGRSTVAAALAHALRRLEIGVLAVAPPSSPLPRMLPADAGVRVVTGLTIKDAELRETAADFGDNPYAVVIDDAAYTTVLADKQGFAESPTLLDEVVSLSARGHRALIVTADAAPVLSGFPSPVSRLLNTVLATGIRIVLTPANRPVALAHNLNLEADQYFTTPPGRGYLAGNRSPMLIQLALPTDPAPRATA